MKAKKTMIDFGWEVEKRELNVRERQTHRVYPVPGREAIMRVNRDGSERLLSLVSSKYDLISHGRLAHLIEPHVRRGDCEVAGVGEAAGGKRVWVQLRLPRVRRVGADELIPYLLLVNTFDGHSALQVVITPQRVVCGNMLVAATDVGVFQRQPHRHVEARDPDWFTPTLHAYRRVIETFGGWRDVKLGDDAIRSYLLQVLPDGRTRASALRNGAWRDEMFRLATDGRGNTTQANRGTLWAAYNGVVEFLDHHSGRMANPFFGIRGQIKRAAFHQALEVEGAAGMDELVEEYFNDV